MMHKSVDPNLENRKKRFTSVLQTVVDEHLRKEIYQAVTHEKIVDGVCDLTTPVKKKLPANLRKNLTDVKKVLRREKRRKEKQIREGDVNG
jgi:hypothetical protein